MQILEDRIEASPGTCITGLFLHLLDTSQLNSRLTHCLFRRHTGADVFLRQELQITANFGVEVAVSFLFGENILQEVRHPRKHGHAYSSLLLQLTRKLPERGQWPAKFCPSAVFRIRAGGGQLW